MGVSNYTPTGISHATSVDFSKRSVSQPVHIVQYDRSLPILAVSLYNNGQLYRLSESMDVSIRLGKPDRTFVYNKALGCDSTRTIVYFEITQQMSLFDGEFYPVIEIMDGNKIANSSTIYLVVDRNPVQHDYIESTIEYKELIDYRDEALKAKEAAKLSETNAKASETKARASETNSKQSETNAKSSETNAKSSETKAKASETNAKSSETKAKSSETKAKASETNAKQSETNAKQSETNAKQSEINAKASETNAKQSETKAKASETNAKQSEINAKASEEASKLSETKAKQSEINAKNSENESVKYGNLSKSYAVGTGNVIRENDSEDNAKKYCETAKSSEFNAKQSETNAKAYLDEIGRKIRATRFEVDFATGELMQVNDNEYIFTINQTTGNLEWEVTA